MDKTQLTLTAAMQLGEIYEKDPSVAQAILLLLNSLAATKPPVEPQEMKTDTSIMTKPEQKYTPYKDAGQPGEIPPEGKRLTLEEQKDRPKRGDHPDSRQFTNAIGVEGHIAEPT